MQFPDQQDVRVCGSFCAVWPWWGRRGGKISLFGSEQAVGGRIHSSLEIFDNLFIVGSDRPANRTKLRNIQCTALEAEIVPKPDLVQSRWSFFVMGDDRFLGLSRTHARARYGMERHRQIHTQGSEGKR